MKYRKLEVLIDELGESDISTSSRRRKKMKTSKAERKLVKLKILNKRGEFRTIKQYKKLFKKKDVIKIKRAAQIFINTYG
jgi:hypothetical protein